MRNELAVLSQKLSADAGRHDRENVWPVEVMRVFSEFGCWRWAVPRALGGDELDSARVDSFHKLQREIHHLEMRQDHRARLEEKARWKVIHKQMRKMNHKRSGR